MTGMCRLCASLKHGLITVTEQSGGLAHKLFLCCRLHLEMEKEGPLPKAVCKECIENLNVSYKFLTEVQEAQEKLHAFFGTPFDKGLHIDDNSDNTQSFTISSVSSLPRTTTTGTTNEVLREYILPENIGVKQELPYDDAQLADAQMEAMTSSLVDDDQNRMITDERPSSKMSNEHAQPSRGTLEYLPQQVNQKCHSCEELSQKFETYKDAAQKQFNAIVHNLKQHKVLLDSIVTQNSSAANIMPIFPINTEEKLKELDAILGRHPDPYIQQIKCLLGGNAERNLHHVFGNGIIMNFNVSGSFGKKRLRDYGNVFSAMIDVISTFSESSDKTLRAAFQRQKKKFFKQTSRSRGNTKERPGNEEDYSDKELSLILNRTSGSGGPQKVIQKTGHNTLKCRCNELTHKLDEIKGQMDILIEANVEHKNILSKHLRQHNETLEIRSHFPIKSEEKLREMDERINNENKQDYVKAVRAIIHPAGVCKNLKYIISTEIIMGYNLEGVHGKKSLKRLVNFYSVILESIPNAAKNAGPAEEQLRKAIQLLKKREFKAISTAKTRKSSNEIRDIRLNFLGKAKKDVSSTLTDESSTFE